MVHCSGNAQLLIFCQENMLEILPISEAIKRVTVFDREMTILCGRRRKFTQSNIDLPVVRDIVKIKRKITIKVIDGNKNVEISQICRHFQKTGRKLSQINVRTISQKCTVRDNNARDNHMVHDF